MVRNILKTNIKQNKRTKEEFKVIICLDSNFKLILLLLILAPIKKILKENIPRCTEALTHIFEYKNRKGSRVLLIFCTIK